VHTAVHSQRTAHSPCEHTRTYTDSHLPRTLESFRTVIARVGLFAGVISNVHSQGATHNASEMHTEQLLDRVNTYSVRENRLRQYSHK